jgi:predicted nucleic acid-binding protein
MSAQFVIDASIALAWCFEDEGNANALEILEHLEEVEAIVPSLWFLEVGNALLGAERRKRLTQAESTHFLQLLRGLPIHIEETSPQRVWGEILSLARTHHLSTYDASYLDLAMRQAVPLATLDDALRQAAVQCSVAVIPHDILPS